MEQICPPESPSVPFCPPRIGIIKLDGITLLLPDPEQFLYSYVRKEAGILREVTGRQRGKLYVYDEYLARLNEGTTEPPP